MTLYVHIVSEIILKRNGFTLIAVSNVAGESPRLAIMFVGPSRSDCTVSVPLTKEESTPELAMAERATKLEMGTIAGNMRLACLVELMLRRLYMFFGMGQLAATRRPNMVGGRGWSGWVYVYECQHGKVNETYLWCFLVENGGGRSTMELSGFSRHLESFHITTFSFT